MNINFELLTKLRIDNRAKLNLPHIDISVISTEYKSAYEKIVGDLTDANNLRAINQLPLYEINKEADKLFNEFAKKIHTSDIDEYTKKFDLERRIKAKLLRRIRIAKDDVNWKPTGVMSNYSFNLQFKSILRKIIKRNIGELT